MNRINENLILTAEVETSNPNMNEINKKCSFSVKLISDAIVSIYSSSSQTAFFISDDMKDSLLNFTHFYEVITFLIILTKKKLFEFTLSEFLGRKEGSYSSSRSRTNNLHTLS